MQRSRKAAYALLTGLAGLTILLVAWRTVRAQDHPLRDIDGVVHGSLEKPASGRWDVLFFMTADCPIANQYAPEIQRICSAYGPKGAQCYLVYADPWMTADQVRTHARDFHQSRYPAILDTDLRLATKAGATVSSEVAVFSRGAALEYRGRIDDFYASLGTPRQHVTTHDLRDALDALVAARSVQNPRTDAIGCFIPETKQETKS